MAETNAPPTLAEVQAQRFDITEYLLDTRDVTDYTASALLQFKNDIEDKKSIKFSQVFDSTNDLYFVATDGTTRNLNKIRKDMLSNLTVALIFLDYSINIGEADTEAKWFSLHVFYRAEYDDMLNRAVLDIDLDEDGEIDEDEERISGQTFMVK